MKNNNIVYPFIGFIIGIIPYLILLIIIKDSLLNELLTIIGLFVASLNSYLFYKKTKYLN